MLSSLNFLFFLVPAVVAGLVIFSLVMWVLSLRRVVQADQVHVVQSGKNTKLYGKDTENGFVYYEIPKWVPFLGIGVTNFIVSNFPITMRNYDAYDIGRLPFVVDIIAYFRIDNAAIASQRVSSFEELKSQLEGVLQGAVRSVLASEKLETIMQDRNTLGEKFTESVREHLDQWGVVPVKSIEFMDIRDAQGSNVIDNIMAKDKSRIQMESRVEVAKNTQAAELAEINAKREIDMNRENAEQQVGIRIAEREREVGIADELSKQQVMESSKVTATREMEVIQIRDVRAAEIAKEVAQVRAEQDRAVTLVAAEAAKQKTVIEADAEKARTTTIAEGVLNAAKNEAEGIRAKGEAEAAALELELMAPVTAQVKLAEEIGSNMPYQEYLVKVEQIGASTKVGEAMAQALKEADLKIIANSGDVQGGLSNLTDLFTAKGGTNIAGMLEALNQTEHGAALLEKVAPLVAQQTKKTK